MFLQIAQALLILVAPFLLAKLTRRMGTQNWLSPVVLCYILGIGLRNLPFVQLDDGVSTFFTQATILLAIPLLLFCTDLLGWFKFAKSTVLGFGLQVFSVIVSALLMGFLFREKIAESGLLSAMLSGVYIGGTSNMNAVGLALGASETTFVTLNAAEIACGGIYLVLLTSVAHRFYGLFLADFQGDKQMQTDHFAEQKFLWKTVVLAFGLAVAIAAASAFLTKTLTGKMENIGVFILFISAFSVGASFFQKIRGLGGSFEAGEYLLLMFSIAIGMMADFSEIFRTGGWYLAISAAIMALNIVLHVLLCRLFRIDRDTMMITQVAGIYGPPFVAQVATVIQNRSLVFSGIATGLVGIAIANFIGVMLGKLMM